MNSVTTVLKSLTATIFIGAFAVLSSSATSALDSLDNIIRLNVLDGGLDSDSVHTAAIQLTLADGWKTYWRVPGDAGIPPELSFDSSVNIENLEIVWPKPNVFDQNGFTSIGYEEKLILPILVTPIRPEQSIRLKGVMDIGICREICIPATLEFDKRLDPQAKPHSIIDAAFDERLRALSDSNRNAVRCSLSRDADTHRLDVNLQLPSLGDNEFAVIESLNPNIFISQVSTRRSGNSLAATAKLTHREAASFILDRSALRITVIGDDDGLEIMGC